MHYEKYLTDNCLADTFKDALQEQQNIVLQAGSLCSAATDFAISVSDGLKKGPRQLECRFLYDSIGSELYEQICMQPEYYPARTEAGILCSHAEDIAIETGSSHLVELGSGSSVKTDYLLSAYQNLYSNLCYTPIDISASALQLAGRQIIKKRPAVQVVGIHGTYNDSFQVLPCISPALIIFLGSTLGNFTPAEEQVFWHDISASMQPGDYFLLGIDLIKEVQILEAAYNDAAGITAAFSKNYLARMNRELGCEIDMDAVDHLAYFNAGESRIEIYLEFLNHQTLYLKPTGATFFIEKGERILIEISRKFQLDEMANALRNYGFRTIQSYTDENRWFALLLLQKKEYF